MKGLEIEAVYENGTLKLPRLLPLAEGQMVTITVHPAAGKKGSGSFVQSTLRAVPAKDPDPFLPAAGVVDEPAHQAASPLGEALLRHAGKAVGLPEDMAAQHDHYLHGTPKR